MTRDGDQVQTLGGFFRLMEIDATDAVQHPDAFERLRTSTVHGILLRDVYSADEVAAVHERLVRHDPPFVQTSFPQEFYSWFYGINLNLAHPDLVGYFEEAARFNEQLTALFPPRRGAIDYLAGLLQKLDGGRPFVAPPGIRPRQRYMFTTLRCHMEGGYIPAHIDNEFALRHSYRHLREMVEPPILSVVLALAEAEQGGALKIFNFRQDTAGDFETTGAAIDVDVEELESVSLRIPRGSAIIIDSGRYLHEVTPVIGAAPRWTLCSFMALSKDHQAMYCWG
ncbi:MAG: 2OG-Fe(II) oxygenase [Acidobacteriota bacterium]|jgi:hypothetical protein